MFLADEWCCESGGARFQLECRQVGTKKIDTKQFDTGLSGTKPFDTSEKNKISEIAEILKGIFSHVRCKPATDEI